MLISRVSDDERGRKEGRGDNEETSSNAHEYQTASELFDLMARNHNFNINEDESLTTRDLVLIYQNIDLGTKLMSNANEFKRKAPNQYVETIVYEDLDSDSDLSEICSSEDIHNVMMINSERINLLSRPSILENTLCHKFGDIKLCCSDLTTEYDGEFVFKNPYIEDQFKSLNLFTNTNKLENRVLPVSLLDFICCKRLEDNCNLYMENVIRYVNHTIEQLKRISNGDYLTEKAKERWREVDNDVKIKQSKINDTKVLANAISIPLYVERKVTGNSTKFHDLIHSSIDIRSLTKILEKKIIVEVPKTLCGSYKLFTKCYDDNLIIRCKKDIPALALPEKAIDEECHVDLVLELDHSGSGHVISNINSIVILQKSEQADLLPLLPYNSSERAHTPIESECEEHYVTDTIEDHSTRKPLENKDYENYNNDENKNNDMCSVLLPNSLSPSYFHVSTNDLIDKSVNKSSMPPDSGYQSYSYTQCGENFKMLNCCAESSFNNPSSDDLRITIQRLNMQASLPEESVEENSSSYNKRRSPTRNRIKSPYENKSHFFEEKKRRRLLEIRQRREKKKLALSVESCKVNRHKYPVPPQTANSVTKLSITNKSFYNSIYGQAVNMEPKPNKLKIRKDRKDCSEELENVDLTIPNISPEVRDMHIQKYINKSYYLDNAVSEMMYMDMKGSVDQEQSESVSMSSNDIKINLNLLSQYITPSRIELNSPDLANETPPDFKYIDENIEEGEDQDEKNVLSNLEHAVTPNNTPLDSDTKSSSEYTDEKDPKKSSTSAEFRKSIDKIYELIHKLGKFDGNETKLCKSKFTAVERVNYNDGAGETSTVQCSDSGTSVKHHLTSSNPSCFSFDKTNNIEETAFNKISAKKESSVKAPNVVPKVVISAKSQSSRVDIERSKKDRRKYSPTVTMKSPDNPLKAISQLLHEFDTAQKSRNKQIVDKVPRKPEVSFADTKVDNNRQTTKKSPRMDNRLDPSEKYHKVPKDRRYRPPVTVQQPILSDSRPGTRALKKKVVDIVDEMKEARGEAVRGPCKLNARLNSLAQPKKTYVQAQIQDFQARYGKSVVTDRLQKLNGSPIEHVTDTSKAASPKFKKRRDGSEMELSITKQSPTLPPVLEKSLKKPLYAYNRDSTPVSNKQFFKQSKASHTNINKNTTALDSSILLPSPIFCDNQLCGGQKSRIPIIPNDIELSSVVSSVDESSTIGSKIHQLIDGMIPPPKKELDINLRDPVIEVFCEKCETQNQTDCDYHHERPLKIKREYIIGDPIPEENDSYHEIEQKQSLVIPGDLESKLGTINNTIFRGMPVGSFQKHLRLKNIKLPPKESMQQVLLLQSGDSNSIILRSTISQNLTMTKTKKDSDLKVFPKMTDLDWITPFPMQMPIVGYSFPKYFNYGPQLKPTLANNSNANENNDKSDKTIQCFKGGPVEQFVESAPQKYLTISSLLKISTTLLEEPEETNEETKTTGEISQDIIAGDKANGEKVNKSGIIPIQNFGSSNSNIIFEQDCITTISRECGDIVNEESVNKVSRECVNKVASVASHMDYTTSLDVLVGLLNEIQNITTCQSQMANTNTEDTVEQREEMEVILKSAAALEHVQQEARNIISITSLDNLRQLESNASILSFYLSNNGDKDTVDNSSANYNLQPLYADKGVSVKMPIDFINKCTDVPSRFLPLTVTQSTNVSNSLIGVLSQPSSHSILTSNDHSNTSLTSLKKIINLPHKVKIEVNEPPLVFIKSDHVEKGNFRQKNVTLRNTDTQNVVISKKSLKKKYPMESNYDPAIKIKRDILVTVYSVLVLTVFAALSFPDILYSA